MITRILIYLILIASSCSVLGCDMSGFSSEPARRIIKKRCSSCHSTKRIYKSKRRPEEWQKIMERMIRHGATPSPKEQQQILGYLNQDYSLPKRR